jgi:hypothetical protein
LVGESAKVMGSILLVTFRNIFAEKNGEKFAIFVQVTAIQAERAFMTLFLRNSKNIAEIVENSFHSI